MEDKRYEYVTANILLAVNESVDSEKVIVPDGNVVAIGAIVAGNPEARILNLSILQNNQEIVRPADVRFSEKTNGGTFKDSLRPVDFQGGRTFEAKIVATATSATEVVAIQVLFMIEKPQLY
ncbi:hypothetical protein SAMN05443667_101255 [Flavobacterium gillisiae]|uniref:Uncharacterized protein n=1 Tax=Flavobacterium gillisiae TaxID=150146 RepID=A0A1H3WXF2_9FLAO|nr:hypothetical protein [Flavobacterium gillisiae]SDZ91012.1 hypothetical protein SAMN05443667_101255 [Flavobacterium gillisiae]